MQTFFVNVALPDHTNDNELAREAALKKATAVAASKGLQAPTLLHEGGVADIKIVLEGGEVAGIYLRNAEITPAISVVDLDYAKDPVKSAEVLRAKMLENGYSVIPHMVDT